MLMGRAAFHNDRLTGPQDLERASHLGLDGDHCVAAHGVVVDHADTSSVCDG